MIQTPAQPRLVIRQVRLFGDLNGPPDKRRSAEAIIRATNLMLITLGREKEAITADFADGFLRDATLCWRCLEKAVKVRSRQPDTPAAAKPKIGT